MVPVATQTNAMKASARWAIPLPCTGCPSRSSAKNASSPGQTPQTTSRAGPLRARASGHVMEQGAGDGQGVR